MARTEEFWNNVYGVFDPSEVLAGERGEHLYCKQDHSPFDGLQQLFRASFKSARPPVAYFAGHRGSGKSSFLLRLLEARKNDCFVVYFDIEHNLESSKATRIDLLYLLGVAIHQAGVSEGLKVDPENLIALAESIETLSTKETGTPRNESINWAEMAKGVLVFTAGMLGSKPGEKLAEALLKPFSITTGISSEIARKREVEPQIQQIINRINLIIGDVETKAGKPLFVIIDGLDKIQRLEQAKEIFLQSRALRGPLCRLLYTVPMLIFTLPEFTGLTDDCETKLLPNVKLIERLDTTLKDEKGYVVMREVVSKRLGQVELTIDELFEKETVDKLIHISGGVMRYLVRYTLSALRKAELKGLDKVNLSTVQQVIDDETSRMTATLTAERRLELVKLIETKLPSEAPLVHELLHSLFILAYRNGETWYYPHPLLWNSLK